MKNLFYTSPKYLQNLKGLDSSASEIDRVSREIPKTALNALAQAQNRRIDLVMIGDSNQLKDGFGFAGAFAEKLGEKYGLYATGIGAPASFSNEKQTEITGAVKTGAPAEIESLWASNSPESYEYLNTTGNPNNGGCIITGTSNINTTKPLRAWFCYGGFSTGSGNFNPSVRVGVSPFTSIAEYGNISTNTTTASKNINFIDIPEDLTRAKTLDFKWCQNILPKYTITAPFVSFFSRFERPDLEKGVSVHTLYGAGGQSLYDMASTLIGYSDLALKNFFEETRRLQLAKYQKPIIVVYINSGLNDLNETEASLGDLNVPVGNSKEAYFDNLNKVIDRIEKVYSDNWDINELHFLIIPSHPTGNQTEVKLDEYRLKCKETYFNRTRCSYINLRDLVTSDYMLSQGYYLASGGDRFHLNKAGYLDLVGKVVDTITEF